MIFICTTALTLLASCSCTELKFPSCFKFGASSASYQIEGAWNVSDKGENVWDRFVHTVPGGVVDNSTGDVACDSYHLWERDVEMAAEVGLDFYRFSISWSRILPAGFANNVSKVGLDYYNKLIDGLLARGVQPVVTIHHFDVPQPIQDLGGWASPLMVDYYVDYAQVLFSNFADRVKTWLSINEPLVMCDLFYNTGSQAPPIYSPDVGPFLCARHVLLAHARAWHLYNQTYKPKYNGKMSIANNPVWLEPATEDDVDLANLANQFGAGRYSHPIYSAEGGWPRIVEEKVAKYSKQRGYPRSLLPPFSKEEIELIRGTHHFYGINHYSTKLVRPVKADETPGPWPFAGSNIIGVVLENDPQWELAQEDVPIVPEGLRRMIGWLREQYGDIGILITENGISQTTEDLDDQFRIDYITKFLEQVLLAINEDGANVLGYSVWSIMDDFEWGSGYSIKFGLYQVDFSSPLRTRTPRSSAKFYSELIRNKTNNVQCPSAPKTRCNLFD